MLFDFRLFLNRYRLCVFVVVVILCGNSGNLTGWIRGSNRWFIQGCNTAQVLGLGDMAERHITI